MRPPRFANSKAVSRPMPVFAPVENKKKIYYTIHSAGKCYDYNLLWLQLFHRFLHHCYCIHRLVPIDWLKSMPAGIRPLQHPQHKFPYSHSFCYEFSKIKWFMINDYRNWKKKFYLGCTCKKNKDYTAVSSSLDYGPSSINLSPKSSSFNRQNDNLHNGYVY